MGDTFYTVFAQVLYDEYIVNKLELSMEIIDDVIPYSWAGLFNEDPLTKGSSLFKFVLYCQIPSRR